MDIVREYAAAYSQILTNKKLHHVYIDAFAGAGLHISKDSGEFVSGSPLRALSVDPPFKEFYFIDLDSQKANQLRQFGGDRPNVHIYEGDCNQVLLEEVFPHVLWEDYRRGLCLLDPYGLQLNWNVVAAAGKMKTIDMFLNFPIMDMNRNFLWRNPDNVEISGINRMNSFWGDDSWKSIAYKPGKTLFGEEPVKQENLVVVDAYRQRLRDVAGFANVAEALPMRNSRGADVYFLIFASQKQVAENIVDDIFSKYEQRGLR